jgi:hypothetical protein
LSRNYLLLKRPSGAARRRPLPLPLALPLAALLLATGCPPRRPAPPAVPSSSAPPVATSVPTELAPDTAGPLRLGMSDEEVLALPNLTVAPVERTLEGMPAPALRIAQFGLPVGLAELEDGRVWRITVVTERYRTPEGARVGMTAKELEALYGPGRVLTGEGNVCAVFEQAPGLSFCFTDGAPDRLPEDGWPQLAATGARVRQILVTGEAATAGGE